MVGRPVKPRPSPNRDKLLEKLRSDLSNVQITTDRETAERALGRPLTDIEWLAIQMTKEGSRSRK